MKNTSLDTDSIRKTDSLVTAPPPAAVTRWYNQAYQEGYIQAKQEDQEEIIRLQSQIQALKEQLALQKNTSTTDNLASEHTYTYNASHFPRPIGKIVIDKIIILANSKREKGKYIINKKTDWYLLWMVLHYFRIYIGSPIDFMNLVNECVIPNLDDEARKEKLSVKKSNFKDLHVNPVNSWRNEINNKDRTKSNKWHGETQAERGINILVKLQELLQQQGIASYNYENQTPVSPHGY